VWAPGYALVSAFTGATQCVVMKDSVHCHNMNICSITQNGSITRHSMLQL
jgi:hypothetical protein